MHFVHCEACIQYRTRAQERSGGLHENGIAEEDLEVRVVLGVEAVERDGLDEEDVPDVPPFTACSLGTVIVARKGFVERVPEDAGVFADCNGVGVSACLPGMRTSHIPSTGSREPEYSMNR
jgi:hypothetical protein